MANAATQAILADAPTDVPAVLKPERYSATALQAAERCLLSARFDREADTAGPEAMVGRIFHDIAAACATRAQLKQEAYITEDAALRVARNVLMNPQEPAPLSSEHHRVLLDMVKAWSRTATFNPAADTYLVEHPVRHPLGTATLSGRLDLLTIQGNTCDIDDWKTGWKVPTRQEVEHLLQLPIYAWHAYEDFPQLEYFNLRLHYVRSGAVRERLLTIDDVLDVELYLATVVARLDKAWAAGEFPAAPGSWCAYCAKPTACPIPEGHRPHSITSTEDAQGQLDALVVEQARIEQRKDVLQAWLEQRELDTGLAAGDVHARLAATKAQRRLDTRAMQRDGIDVEQYRKTTGGGTMRLTIDRATEGES